MCVFEVIDKNKYYDNNRADDVLCKLRVESNTQMKFWVWCVQISKKLWKKLKLKYNCN